MQRWLIWLAVALSIASAPAEALGDEPPAMSHAMSPGAKSQEHSPTWVFFRDKRVQAAESHRALAARSDALSVRALSRRQRVRGDRGLDERDLDVPASYIEGVRGAGARIRATSRWLNAVSVMADADALAVIDDLPYVSGRLPVVRRSKKHIGRGPGGGTTPSDPSPFSSEAGVAADQLALIQVPELRECGLSGAGVVVAVLDTGFVLSHQAFAQLDVLAQRDFINDDDITENELNDPPGQHNHGTSVLSLLAGSDPGDYLGVAPDVTVILAKTEDISMEQPIEEDWFVEGMEWAESLGADLLTASLGYIDWYTPADLDGMTAVTTVACNIALGNGLILLSAAGNDGPNPTTIIAPADAPGLIAVGAVDVDGVVTGFSSRGPTADMRIKPDVCAQGRDNWVVSPSTTDAYQQGNGTSYATPMVAGVAALLLQAYPDLTPAEMHALLTSTATNAATPDNDYGWGIVRGFEAAGLFCTCRDVDVDGFFDAGCGGDDCDDTKPLVHLGGQEICNGVDDDCDGALFGGEEDADDDGSLACADDCDDGEALARPGLAEVCDDQIDNDCNGDTDADDAACFVPPEPPPTEAPPLAADGSCGCRVARDAGGMSTLMLLLTLGLALYVRRSVSAIRVSPAAARAARRLVRSRRARGRSHRRRT